MSWALTAVAWVQSALPEEHPQPVPVTECNDVACVAASNAGESHRQTRIGAILAAGIRDESPQYIGADDSKRTRCPRVAAQIGASPLNLTIPSHALAFEGPSHTQRSRHARRCQWRVPLLERGPTVHQRGRRANAATRAMEASGQ